MFLIQTVLNERGISSNIYAEHIHPELTGKISKYDQIKLNPGDILIVHHSFQNGVLDFILALECQKILIFHNITKPSFFEDGSVLKSGAAEGYRQLWRLREAVLGSITDSDFNSAELTLRGFQNVETIFLLKDFEVLPNLPYEPAELGGDTPSLHLLFVGRVVENKGHDALIAALPNLQAYLRRRVRLLVCGEYNSGSSYFRSIHNEVARMRLEDDVVFLGSVSDETLFGLYRGADAYVSYSEHEGFGVPLLEAMAFGTPVIAYACTAVTETVGGGGILLGDREPETLAHVLAKLSASRSWRRSVIRRQRQHLANFSLAGNIGKFFRFLEKTAGFAVPTHTEPEAPDVKRMQITIQGAAVGSYSLSIVNRGFVKALAECDTWATRLMPLDDVHMPNSQAIARSVPEDVKELAARPFRTLEPSVGIRSNYPLGAGEMVDDLRLAYLFWEENPLPSKLVHEINRKLDGLIAPSTFCAKIYKDSGVRVPVRVVGCGTNNGVHEQSQSHRAEATLQDLRCFKFLHVSSGLERKGIWELLDAYRSAFTKKDDVLLTIKSYQNPTNVIERYLEEVGRYPDMAPVNVIYDEYSESEMQNLYMENDVVVLPTKGEGYNLPAAEAINYGINLVVTGYGGHMDFCNEDNAILLDYSFKRSGSHLRTFHSYWAQPDADQLAKLMRSLYEKAMHLDNP